MKTRDKVILIALAVIAFGWIIYLVKSVLAPFIFSLVAAYLLNPLVDYLTRRLKFSRLLATSLIIGLFITILTIAGMTILPIIYTQLVALIDVLPTYYAIVTDEIYPLLMEKLQHYGVVLHTDLTQIIDQDELNAHLLNMSQQVFKNALSSSLTLINLISLLFITPVLIFYLLKDWNILLLKIRSYLPRNVSGPIEELMKEMDRTMSGYIRGQINVCLILALAYGIGLNFTGLNFGFLIGFLTGIFAFIPYVAMIGGITAATIVGLFQWGFDGAHITIVASVFITIHLIESNYLTPKLIGEKVGLHPVWVIFGLFFFGALFGFTGVLLALPLSAASGVIIRFFALRYKKRYTNYG